MTLTSFCHLLDELFEVDEGTIKGNESLEALHAWDSLAILSFMALADEKFGVTLEPRALVACKTVPDLIALLGDRITSE